MPPGAETTSASTWVGANNASPDRDRVTTRIVGCVEGGEYGGIDQGQAPLSNSLAVDEIGEDPTCYLVLTPTARGRYRSSFALDRRHGPAVTHPPCRDHRYVPPIAYPRLRLVRYRRARCAISRGGGIRCALDKKIGARPCRSRPDRNPVAPTRWPHRNGVPERRSILAALSLVLGYGADQLVSSVRLLAESASCTGW